MRDKTEDWLDDYLHQFPPAIDFGSDPRLAERQREMYEKLRREKTHMYDKPRPLRKALRLVRGGKDGVSTGDES